MREFEIKYQKFLVMYFYLFIAFLSIILTYLFGSRLLDVSNLVLLGIGCINAILIIVGYRNRYIFKARFVIHRNYIEIYNPNTAPINLPFDELLSFNYYYSYNAGGVVFQTKSKKKISFSTLSYLGSIKNYQDFSDSLNQKLREYNANNPHSNISIS